MKVRLHSEEDKKLSFWLNDFKNNFEDNHQGVSLDYSFFSDDEDYYTSVSIVFYPDSFRNEILIDINQCDIYEIMDKIRQRVFSRYVV
jgi:hypothetical protein